MVQARIALLFIVLACLAACSQDAGQQMDSAARTAPVSTPDVPAAGLPSLAELAKRPSLANAFNVTSPLKSYGASPGVGGLDLSLDSVATDGEKAIAYAVYMVSGLTANEVALRSRVTSDFKAANQIALANWDTGKWDFSQGAFFGGFTFAFDDFPGGRDPYIDGNGNFAIAFVMLGASGLNTIQELEIDSTADPNDVLASDDRYDGVKVTWQSPEGSDGIQISRRPQGSSDPWTVVTAEPLPPTDDVFLDTASLLPVNYDYKVQSGVKINLMTGTRWFWGAGLLDSGMRSGIIIDGEAGEPLESQPANLYNYMSFFLRSEDSPSAVSGLRSTTFPPQNGWAALPSGDPGIGAVDISSDIGMGTPFGLHQHQSINVKLVTFGFSKSDGTYSQVATITEDGAVSFEAPVKPLPAGTSFLEYCDLPRAIGALYWDPAEQEVKMLESWDESGRQWRDESDMPASWITVSDEEPDGPIFQESRYGLPLVAFRAVSGEVIVKELDGGWVDETPGGLIGFAPHIWRVSLGSHVEGLALSWLNASRDTINVITRNFSGDWNIAGMQGVGGVEGGGPIQDFKIHAEGAPSIDNYLVFLQDGNVYLRQTSSTNLTGWGAPVPVDTSGGCSNLDLVIVGSDESFNYRVFATYLVQDTLGRNFIAFRDIKQVYQEQTGN
jgi:hypothetical protein